MAEQLEIQQKMTKLEKQNVILQQQISVLKKKVQQLQQYRIKHQLCLQKQQDKSILNKKAQDIEISDEKSKLTVRHKQFKSKTKQLIQKELLLQELQYEKACLESEREQVENLKAQTFFLFKEEIQKQLELEKQALIKRHKLIEAQQMRQIQREIREKAQLQEQIRQMKETIQNNNDPEKTKKQMGQKKQ